MSIDPVLGGGTAERTIQMTRALIGLGHSCSILTLDLGISKEKRFEITETLGIELVSLSCISERFYFPWPHLKKISALVKQADIIHLMGHWTIINAIVYFYIKKFNKKYVVCPAGALPIFGRSKIIKFAYNLLIGKKIIKNADAHLIIAKDEILHFKAYGINENKIFWIPNGIDPQALIHKDETFFREKYHLGSSPFILYMGRLNTIKGPDLIVEAFCELKEQLKNYHLVLAGPDEGMLPLLKKTVRKYDLENNVHFIGHISGKIKSCAFNAASLMVIPSRQEAMSIVVLEAGIVGLPVLLTNQCGLNDLQQIDAGIVVDPSVKAIKNGLVEILVNNENKLELFGENLKKHVQSNFLWESIVKKIESLYIKILNE